MSDRKWVTALGEHGTEREMEDLVSMMLSARREARESRSLGLWESSGSTWESLEASVSANLFQLVMILSGGEGRQGVIGMSSMIGK